MARQAKGFNLIEVMFSILILGVGLVAVASLFPVAGKMQQRTFEDVLLNHAESNIRTVITSRGFSIRDLYLGLITQAGDEAGVPMQPPTVPPPEVEDPELPGVPDLLGNEPPDEPEDPDPTGTGLIGPTNEEDETYTVAKLVAALNSREAHTIPPHVLDSDHPFPAEIRWNESERRYPTDQSLEETFVWVPLYQAPNPLIPEVVIHVFILKHEPHAEYANPPLMKRSMIANPDDPSHYPRVLAVHATPTSSVKGIVQLMDEVEFQVGDMVLDSEGTVHHVLEVMTDQLTGLPLVRLSGVVPHVPSATYRIWYGMKNGQRSPTRRIVTFIPNALRL